MTISELTADCLVTVGGNLLVDRTAIGRLSFSSLTTVGGAVRPSYNEALASVSLPSLTTVGGSVDIHVNPALTSLSLPVLRDIGGDLVLLSNDALESVSVPVLEAIRYVNVWPMPGGQGITATGNRRLTSLAFPALTTMGAGSIFLSDNPALISISAPQLVSTRSIWLLGEPALADVSLPRLATMTGGLGATSLDVLTVLSLPELTTMGLAMEVRDNPALASLSLPRLTMYGGGWLVVMNNARLAQCLVDALLAQLQTGGFTGSSNITDNRVGCTCELMGGVLGASCP